jgi:nitroreductase
MTTLEAIHSRRSIRRFTEQSIDKETVAKILTLTMSAPSAGNAQPWQFIVIDDPELLKRIPKVSPYANFAKNAPLSIVVCAEPSLEKFQGLWPQDCACATQTLLLAAHGLGLGACWTGIYPVEDRVAGFRGLLGLPEGIIPVALVVLGYPGVENERLDRFDPSFVHKNAW